MSWPVQATLRCTAVAASPSLALQGTGRRQQLSLQHCGSQAADCTAASLAAVHRHLRCVSACVKPRTYLQAVQCLPALVTVPWCIRRTPNFLKEKDAKQRQGT